MPERPAASASFREAITIARRQNAKSLELRAATSVGRLLSRRGERDEAHRIVGETLAWFTEGFDLPDLTEAAALIEELS